jgi:hypothetical protein
MGATEDARSALLAIRAEAGDAQLQRVVALAGPASALAERVLGEKGPYR